MSRARDRLHIQPLGTSRRLALVEMGRRPRLPGMTKVAEHDNSGQFGARDIGWLVQLASGSYALLTVQGSLQPVNQRKAEMALGKLRKDHGKDADFGRDENGTGEALP